MPKTGYLEDRYIITDSLTGESVETVSTVAMFLQADDYADQLRKTRKHTEQWVMKRFSWAHAALAAAHEGLFEMDGELDEATLGEFVNRFTFETVPDDPDEPGEGAENPTRAAQGAGLEA